jgi:hypothetical protein
MPRPKTWTGFPGYNTGLITIPNSYPSLTSLFPPLDQSTNTLLHVRFQPAVTLAATRASGTNTPAAIAWDDIQVCMWTWLNRYDGQPAVDLGAFAPTAQDSDKRLLSVDTLLPLVHTGSTNPVHEAMYYGIPGGVSVETHRIAFGAEDSPFSVDVGIGFYDAVGLFGNPLTVSGINYQISGRFLLRALWEGNFPV